MDALDEGYDHYRFKCSFEGNGEIANVDEQFLWTMTTERTGKLLQYGLLTDPGCAFSKPDGSEPLLVTRKRQFLPSQFEMKRGEERLCTITQTNLLHNSYRLEFARGEVWTFQMPLFSVYFQGTSETGHIVQVREWSKRQWFMRVQKEANEPLLSCALILVQRERLRAG